jgi:tetratricopeptide (TPR) repeat protein
MEVVTTLGQVLVKGGQLNEAIALLDQYVTDSSAPAEVLSLLAAAYASVGRFSSAVPMLEGVTKRLPENDRARFLLGYARAELGEGEAATAAYESAIRLNPKSPVYYNHYASLLERQGRLAQAEENLRKSLLLQPESGLTRYAMGRILTQLGRHEEAITHLQKSVAAGHPPTRAYYLLANCYARLGDTSRAKEYRDRFAQASAQNAREEYINHSGDVEARSFGRSQPPGANSHP